MSRRTSAVLAGVFCLLCGVSPWARSEDKTVQACATPAHGEFDFWIGDWDVSRPDGQPAGTSHVEKILGGCVVFENWQSASGGYAGKSFNTYDPVTGRWNQVWVDTGGDTIQFSGRRKGNVMSLSGIHATGRGTLYYRLSFTLNGDGTVRQLWRQSVDRRKWEVLFDGLYRRRTEVAAQ